MTQATDPFELVGKTLDGRYQIEELIGEGGFGAVYRGVQLVFTEPVAIKVLHYQGKTPQAQQAVFESFRNEGKILRRLCREHPAFVEVLDMNVTRMKSGNYVPYIVMEWLAGESLESDLERRRAKGLKGRPIDQAIALLQPIAEALAIAHAQEQRIAHRDIKPPNIFLARTAGGTQPKLLDFGIAKVMIATGTAAFLEETRIGLRGAGSPDYIAPEQVSQNEYGASGPWTDVYALALVFVELLTGERALVGDTIPALMGATLSKSDRPTPRRRNANVSRGVEKVFEKALALHPKDRFSNAKAFWSALVEEAGAGSAGNAVIAHSAFADTIPVPDREFQPSGNRRFAIPSQALRDFFIGGKQALRGMVIGALLVSVPMLGLLAWRGCTSASPHSQVATASTEAAQPIASLAPQAPVAPTVTPSPAPIQPAPSSEPASPDPTASAQTTGALEPSAKPIVAAPKSVVDNVPPPVLTDGEPGFLTIVCNPFCDDILDNGRTLGPSPVVHLSVKPGTHRITLRKGSMRKSISVIVVSGQVTAQRVSMK